MRVALFPFDKVPKGSTVVIYGAGGAIGREFVNQIKLISYCKIAACLDKNYEKVHPVCGQDVLSPESIKNITYDYIVVAAQASKQEIYDLLIHKFAVAEEKIILIENNFYITSPVSPVKGSFEKIDWTSYYISAESAAQEQYEHIIEPIFKKHFLLNPEMVVMDFACGRGRIAQFLKDKYKKLILCDISVDALDYCKDRFKNNTNIEYIQSQLEGLLQNNESLDFIYSWDAMVHFKYKYLDLYISEFGRMLKKGGYCFIHHSNLENCELLSANEKSENYDENYGWRAKVSKQDVAKLAERNNLEVLEQQNLKWEFDDLDCITVLRKKL